MSKKWLRNQQIIVFLLMTAIAAMIVFYGYRPVSYDLSIGSVCNTDIYAPRSFVDSYQTEYEATVAKNSVKAVFVRSETLSQQSVDNTSAFYNLVSEARTNRSATIDDETPAVPFKDFCEDFNKTLTKNYNNTLSNDSIHSLTFMSTSAFNLLSDKSVAIAEIIMMDNVSSDSLNVAIDNQVAVFVDSYPDYATYSSTLAEVLRLTLNPNSVFDKDATSEAADNAYLTALSNSVIVDKGTKIISSGDVITEHTYQSLVDLELVRSSSFDIVILVRIFAFVTLVMVVMAAYILNSHIVKYFDMKMTYTMVISFLIPIAASLYLSDLSSVMVVTLFFTTIAATYLGVSSGIILSVASMVISWPLYNFDNKYVYINVIGIFITSIIAGRQNRRSNSASLIIIPMISCILACASYNFVMGSTTNEFIETLVFTGVSSAFAIIIAIGLMPIYELFSNAVSPVRLIELSQPGHPLLKRLFMEASGTHSHSMMVANLADSAAEAVGADALLCKVAAYYHDIGKLENPIYFTENQADGYNPHNDLTTEESVAIITSHPTYGVQLAHKHHLPEAIIKIIDEHHGTTVPGYFYTKAVNAARDQGLPDPDVSAFAYKGHVPSSRESAIIMIADTCEAAVKSAKLTKIEDIEPFIRKLIKAKIEQDQLINSGLSFADIEKIIRAFLHVYAGANHERIAYPDDNRNN
ncbi:MAG: HDIG domain-containing protein [Saccharofermentans sp.]|nr:HDIG domain-containing protein [Saccharofermentans sp.]